MAATLPEETIVHILSLAIYRDPPRRAIHDDDSHHSTLRAASLTCRSWRLAAQSLLWKRVRLASDVDQVESWLKVAKLRPTQTLSVWSRAWTTASFFSPIRTLAPCRLSRRSLRRAAD